MRTLAALLVLILAVPSLAATDSLVVHEWGTFTSLQDETGRSIGGVNIDDEALPKFVHRLGLQSGQGWDAGKSLYPGSPSVTMRLETPVIYFYPPDDKPMSVDVSATFNGGVLSEFFPNAQTTLDGRSTRRSPEYVSEKTRGTLAWNSVMLNTPGKAPETDAHVWLAPRQVAAAPVVSGNESEKYIFYRGAGHVEAPLKVARAGNAISVNPQASLKYDMSAMPMWLAEFRGDKAAFRAIKVGDNPGTFADPDFASDNVTKVRAAMKQTLVSSGLFDDEAEAMLETWKLSYFKSSGQRLFYLVPRQWTDDVLPLTISKPAKITRVMIGRIELVTPQQRDIAQRLTDKTKKLDEATTKALYQQLGRFGGALVNDAYWQRAQAAKAAQVNAAR